MKARLRRFVRIWIDLFSKHALLDHASSVAFQVLKSLIPLTLLGLAILGATGQEHVWRETIAPAIKPHLEQPMFHAIDYGVEKIFTTNSAGLRSEERRVGKEGRREGAPCHQQTRQ